MNAAKKIDIKLSELILWDKNARLPLKHTGKPEDEIISHFCQDKNFKITELAKAIVEDFLLPQMESLIVLNRDGKNIVYEGNRRLIVYKLLNNPSLAPNKELRDLFEGQKEGIAINDEFLLDCIVTADEDTANKYLKRKHLDGNNEVNWTDLERANYKRNTGTQADQDIRHSEIAKVIRGLTELSEEVKDKVLGPGYVTTLWRLLDSGHAIRKYGYKLENEKLIIAKEKLFKKELSTIVTDISNRKDSSDNAINSRAWHSISQKADYLNSLSNADNKSKKTENKDNSPSIPRNRLISEECSISISNKRYGRINNIYSELRNSLLLSNSRKAVPNAVGVLFRVFLEISLDHYYSKKQGGTFTTKDNISKKIGVVTNHMEEQKIANSNQLKPIRTVRDKRSYLSIEHFHSFVHSGIERPEPSDLILKWDNLEEFFEILWNDLEEE